MIHSSEYLIEAIQQERRDEAARVRRTHALRVAARGATPRRLVLRRRLVVAPVPRAEVAA